ncbi:MAG: TonB-dependent receptor [Bacteroidales bacterium]|nr:TonB-dependent receptor [Bacteroidales bacterium]
MKRLLMILAMLCMGILLRAQTVAVSGRITDSDGQPLAGAVVYPEKDPSGGTVSGNDGKWSITVAKDAVLVFNCLGYKEMREKVDSRTVINVTMQDDKLLLDAAEVVSDGYMSVAKRDLTGSVASVSMDKLSSAPVTNFDQALSGRVAGVVVTTGDGAVGSEANIVIRGNNSLTQGNSPLFVVDGFISESSLATSINPADIETIDILKDASSTAIYGARGANGVIVIQTRQGAEGKPRINFKSSWSLNTVAKRQEMMGAYDFVLLQEELTGIKGSENIYTKNGYTLDDYRNVEGVNWQDRIYRLAFVQDYNISISGGSKSSGTSYNASFSALDQDGIIVNSNFQRYSAKMNLAQKIGKKLKLDLNMSYSRSLTNGVTPSDANEASSASGWLMYSVWAYRPVLPLYSMDDVDEWMDDFTDASDANDYRFNPAKTVRNEYKKKVVNYMKGNGGLSWYMTKDITFKVTGGYTFNSYRNEEFNGTQTYTGFPASPSGKGINGKIVTTNTISWQNDWSLTWRKTFRSSHNINAVAGFAMQGEKKDCHGVAAWNMTTEALGLEGMNTGQYQNVTPFRYNWKMMSAFLRFNYDYMHKYYATVTFRADGSSKFPKDNRWGFFPSGSLAWNFSQEDFFSGFKPLSNGKLRLSYGVTGNNRTSTPYDFYSQIASSPGSSDMADYTFNGMYVQGYQPVNMANEKLKWELTSQLDAGIDLAFFGDRLKITYDWYRKLTSDLLLAATIPSSSGYTSEMLNIGSIRNSGHEISIDAVPVRTRHFEWSTSFNIAFNRNTVTGLNLGQQSLLSSVSWDTRFNSQYAYITQVGAPTGLMYGFIYEGTYKEEDFNASGILNEDVPYMVSVGKGQTQPGDARYRDINLDGVIDDNDRTVIGSGQPVHTGGFSNSFYFYGVDINIFMNWSYGNSILNANRLYFENAQWYSTNQFASYRDRFNAQANPRSDIPRVFANGTYVYSSRVVEDGSYLRIRSISIGYTLPSKLLSKARISSCRIGISIDNPVTFIRYSGADPEVSTRSSVLTPGFDWSAYARARGGSISLNLSF